MGTGINGEYFIEEDGDHLTCIPSFMDICPAYCLTGASRTRTSQNTEGGGPGK